MKLSKAKLKGPDLKVPPFLGDLFYDLRERRLLPLVALVIVAILAVPFLLGDGSEEELSSAPGGAAVAPPAEAETASLAVVEAKPGLRDYKKRLRGRTPTDPFEQRYTGVPEGAQLSVETTTTTSSAGDGASGAAGSEAGATGDPAGTAPQSTPPSSGGSGGSGKTGGTDDGDDDSPLDGRRLFGFRPNIRFGLAGSGDLALHEELPLGTFLPKSNPVLVFIGVTQNGNRALFDVSREVSWVQGDGDCVGGKAACQVISLKKGQAANLQTATGTFRLAVIDIDFVEIDVPRKASSSTAKTDPHLAGLSQSFSK